MINRFAFIFVVMVVLITLARGEIQACSCEYSDRPLSSQVIEAKEQADAVFTGRIIKIIEDWDAGYTSVELKVIDVWKGVSSETITILTGIHDGNCRVQFKTGDTYLIYANNNRMYSQDGGLSTGICHRTANLSKAKADLKYLGKPTKLKTGDRTN